MLPEPEPPREVPGAPGVSIAERVSALMEVLLCSGFPTQLFLIMVLSAFGLPMTLDGGRLNPQAIFIVSLLDAVLVVGLVIFLLGAHGDSAREVLIGRVRLVRESLVGIALIPATFFIVLVVMAIVLTFAPTLHNVPKNPLEGMMTTPTHVAVFSVVVTVAGGIREEVQRGFVIRRFEQYFGGGWGGVAFYSVLFGLGHYEQGYDASIATGLLGAFWGTVYMLRRSIVAPMVSHTGFNLAQILKFVAIS